MATIFQTSIDASDGLADRLITQAIQLTGEKIVRKWRSTRVTQGAAVAPPPGNRKLGLLFYKIAKFFGPTL